MTITGHREDMWRLRVTGSTLRHQSRKSLTRTGHDRAPAEVPLDVAGERNVRAVAAEAVMRPVEPCSRTDPGVEGPIAQWPASAPTSRTIRTGQPAWCNR